MAGPTHRRTWQKREAGAAALFGARRAVLSGSGNRDDRSTSDSTHERLYLEVKSHAKSAAVSLLDATAAAAKREGKTPVVVLSTKRRPGFAVLCRAEDLPAIAREYQSAHEAESREAAVDV